ncbi:MAG: NADH-quinone oxidoreductase subunit A [Planctomycetes bacterium]|nr:NADH-quinone oxidoreductase subunit A [Planctomycetota bacterium]
MLFDFANILIFIVAGLIFIFGTLLLGWFLRPSKPDPVKETPYECGEQILGSASVQFNIRFYVIALIFIVFEVEIVLLFPWAAVFRPLLKTMPWEVLGDMLVFVGILLVGLAYVWVKGDLEWVKPHRGPRKD